MKRFASIVLVTISIAARAMAADAELQLKLTGTNLSAAAAAPSVVAGQKLRLILRNTSIPPGATWKMRMSGGPEMPAVISGPDVTFEGMVPNISGNTLTVTFDDDSNTLTMSPPLVFTLTDGTTSSSTATTPAAANVLTEKAFRRTYDQAGDFVNLYFNSAGMLVRGDIPRDIDDNDVFRFYVYGTAADATSIVVDVEGTLSSADDFSVLGSGSLGTLTDLTGKIQAEGLTPSDIAIYRLGTFGPFAPPSITVKVSKQSGTTKTLLRQYPIRINKTYLAAYRLLGAKSDIRYNSYTAAPLAGKTGNFIQNTAAEDGDVRYFLTLVPYAWGLSASSWRGRDTAKLPLWYERFNPVLGIGIKNAGKEFALGVSVEVARGFDVVVARHRVKVPTLAGGFSEGDAFAGASNTIPTIDKTQNETVFGVSLDLRVATQMLSSLFK